MEGALDDNGRGQGPWQCGACTFENENAHGLACLMCGTERSIASPPIASNGGRDAAASPAAPVLNVPAGENSVPARETGAERRRASPTAERGHNPASCSRQCQKAAAEASTSTQPPGRASAEQPHGSKMAAVDNGINDEKDAAGKKGTWDAFASLENNYQSSDESDDGEEEEDHGDDDDSREGRGSEHDDEDRKMGTGAGSGGWDAFKSLEQNYESSEEECDSSSSEEEAEFSDGDHEEGGDQSAFNEIEGKKPSPECVDLVDSDEDEIDCELEVVAAMPGKENNKNDKKRSSKRKRSQKYEPYTIDGDSDSSLSEVEGSRPLPSPSARPLPPWQRRRSTPISIGKNGSLKGRDAFSCLTARGDVLGGSGAGVSGVRLAKRKGEEAEGTTATRKSRRTSSAAASKASATDASTTASTAKTKPTRKRRRTTTKAKSAPAKRRRKRTYRKSNKRSARGGRSNASASTRGRANNNNNAWSARERGIRNRRGGGESAPYMNIAKQEPMLRNVGGASIQF